MRLNIFSGSIVCGDRKCNANCPWCISKMLARNCGWKMPEEAEYSGEDVVASVENARSWITVPRRYVRKGIR